jgi:prepilin-type N-terminal cleavage/methylation domain-containing protein
MKSKKFQKGFSLIEVLVGILLVVVIFTGIIGAFTLTLKITFQSKARITAISLASKTMEKIRNLPYSSVGTVGGIPSGVILQTEQNNINSINFTITTSIINIDDAFDGKLPTDTVPADYKRAKVKVSWPGMIGGEVILLTDISPKGIETTAGGGTISLFVQDASGNGVGQAEVNIINTSVTPQIDVSYLTDDYGYLVLAGAPTSTEAYKVTVEKTGYSSQRTYSRAEIANPNKPHLSVYVNSLTEPSFSIDKVSTLNIETRAQESFSDDFNDFSKTSEHSNVELSTGKVQLKKNGQYATSGYLISQAVAPSDLVNWDSFEFSDQEGEYTKIKYRFYYATGTEWLLIPDGDLANNNAGFETSPVDLSGLDTGIYPSIKIWADFTTSDTSVSPTLDNWYIYYNTPLLDNVPLKIIGAKTLGTDTSGKPVYRYSKNEITNPQGKLIFENMEWDSYSFEATSTFGLNLLRISPSNPLDLMPNTIATAKLYYKAENSLLVTVLNSSDDAPIFGASVHLLNGGGYSRVLPSDKNGKSYFLPLDATDFTIDTEADGYASSSVSVSISGENLKTIYLTPND